VNLSIGAVFTAIRQESFDETEIIEETKYCPRNYKLPRSKKNKSLNLTFSPLKGYYWIETRGE